MTVAPAAGTFLARARTDASNRMIEADDPLAALQQRCGGTLPGKVAIPELLSLVHKARALGLRLGRTIRALDGEDVVKAWVEVAPDGDGGAEGCTIGVASWQVTPAPAEDAAAAAARKLEIDRQLAELTARLDPKQGVLAVESEAPDLRDVAVAMRQGVGKPWTEFVAVEGIAHRQPLHWRLLDGSTCRLAGSDRKWTATLVPLGAPEPGSAGFELLLVADRPLAAVARPEQTVPAARSLQLPGQDLAPVLRQPVARIIANAETIRARLAGPLADEYSGYAADIAAAGQHLLALIDDLADLEVVEAEEFSTAADRIDLADVARRAAGILGVRARERDIAVVLPEEESLLAIGEFRRVLQILLNLVGNAINYGPANSTVRIALSRDGDTARIAVTDEGRGLPADQHEAVFEKFERLGRSGDGGSGLGLYISRRLARAMGGDLVVDSEPGEGATFTLSLPALEDGRARRR